MRVVVLCHDQAWHYLDLKRAAGSDHEVVNLRFEELAAQLNCAPAFNVDADCVIVRTMPAGSLQQIVFRMDLLGQLAQRGTLVLNSPKSIEASIDKYLCSAKLDHNNIPVPPTAVSETVPHALAQFERLGGDVLIKPLFGSMGRGIKRVTSGVEAELAFAQCTEKQEVIYQQKYIDHGGSDIRLLVIGETVLGMKRVNPGNCLTNINQGASGIAYSPTEHERELAIRSANAVNARYAGVDLIYDTAENLPYVLEVNAAPGWQAISSVAQVDVAKLILDDIQTQLKN